MEHHIRFAHEDSTLVLLDQRYLPGREEYFACRTVEDVVYALKEMVVRGAPAIGVSAAWGCVLAARQVRGQEGWEQKLDGLLDFLAAARPTAVNLAWAVERMRGLWKAAEQAARQAAEQEQGQASRRALDSAASQEPGRSGEHTEGGAPDSSALEALIRLWTNEATRIQAEDIASNRRMGEYGAEVIESGDTVMTHCNAGSLATAGFGTALGVIYAAQEAGKDIRVIANETRPFLQGARLTAYELQQEGVPVTIACDNACALLMHQGRVNKVVVGADRIAANGDAANKIGTFGVALLAKHFGIPFYIAAPLSTIDRNTATGADIPIEQRTPREVTHVGATCITPEGVPVFNFAFDVTPADLIAGIITEKGVVPANQQAIAELFVE